MQSGYSSYSYFYDNAALILKECLRGARHLTLYARYLGLKVLSSFPAFIRRPTRSVVTRVDHLAEEVERRTSFVIHQYLDPDITRDSQTATFSKIIIREDAPVVFAKISYDNLKLIVAYLSPTLEVDDKFFISEMLSACAYRKSAAHFAEFEKDRTKAGLLAAQMMHQGVIRTHNSTNAVKSASANVAQLAKVSCFAHLLWMVIARDYAPEQENNLLYACCDLSAVIAGQIEEAGEDPHKLGEILKVHAEII